MEYQSFLVEMDLIMYASDKGFYIHNIIPERSYEVCMVVNPSSEVYDANGNIYPCWEFPYTPMYENSKHRIGNLNDDKSNYNNNAIVSPPFLRQFKSRLFLI